MVRFALRRLGETVAVLLGASVVIFVVLRVVPGDAVDILFSDEGGGTAEQRAQAAKDLGLDQPLPVQFLSFLGGIARADLGESIRQRTPVVDLLKPALAHTIELTFASLAIAILIAVPIAIVSALRQNSRWDRGGTALSLFGISMPSFWQGIMLILLFSVTFPIFPASGVIDANSSLQPVTGFTTVDAVLTGNWAALSSALSHLVLPAFTLGTTTAAMIARLLRSSLLEVKNLEFVEALRARGLARHVVIRHMLRNALPATVIVLGSRLGTLLGGTLVVEVVFGWPGLGWLLITSLDNRDYPIVQGAVLLATLLVVLSNLLADLIHGWLDPRVNARRSVKT